MAVRNLTIDLNKPDGQPAVGVSISLLAPLTLSHIADATVTPTVETLETDNDGLAVFELIAQADYSSGGNARITIGAAEPVEFEMPDADSTFTNIHLSNLPIVDANRDSEHGWLVRVTGNRPATGESVGVGDFDITTGELSIWNGVTWETISGVTSATEIREALETLTGANRLDATAIQNLPTGGLGQVTGTSVRDALMALMDDERLSATAIRDLPAAGDQGPPGNDGAPGADANLTWETLYDRTSTVWNGEHPITLATPVDLTTIGSLLVMWRDITTGVMTSSTLIPTSLLSTQTAGTTVDHANIYCTFSDDGINGWTISEGGTRPLLRRPAAQLWNGYITLIDNGTSGTITQIIARDGLPSDRNGQLLVLAQ